MGKRLKRLGQRAMDASSVSSMLEVIGVSELLLTGCRSLIDFNEEKVIVDTVSGLVTVYGEQLCVNTFRADLLCVCGTLTRVEFGEGETC